MQLAYDVYWVPYNAIGIGDFSYEEVLSIVSLSPEKKRQTIKTLYDAILLFVLSNYCEFDDTEKVKEGDIEWEHYKPGFTAVQENGGCCSTCCAWLGYIFSSKLEGSGIFGIIRPRGGHAINYLFIDGWYYFVDLQTFLSHYIEFICPQSGKRTDFMRSRFLTGALIKAKSIEAFAKYYRRYSFRFHKELLFIDERLHSACPIGTNADVENRHIYIPSIQEVRVVDIGETRDIITYEFVDYQF